MRYFSIILISLLSLAQAQLPVLSLEKDTLLILQGEQVLSPKGDVIFSTKGNIVFEGNSSSYKDILYTLAIDSISQKKKGVVYNRKGSESEFFVKESIIYVTKKEEAYPVSTLVRNADNWAIYNNLNDSLLAFIPATQVSGAQLFAVFYALWNSKGLNDQLNKLLKPSNNQVNDGLAAMVPVLGNGWIWVWDGTYLYPNGVPLSHPMVWKFENNKLSPVHYPRTQEEWRWDGQGLKPFWGGNPQSQWEWRSGVLRQVWNNNYKNEYFIDENQVIRNRFGIYGDNEWQIEGDMPLPLVTAIILGIVNR